MDYKVLKIESFPVNWYEEKESMFEKDDQNRFIALTSGCSVKEISSCRSKWRSSSTMAKRFASTGIAQALDEIHLREEARVESAEIDPDHKIQIDAMTSTTVTRLKRMESRRGS